METTGHLLLSCKQTEIAPAWAKLWNEIHSFWLSLKILMPTKIGIGKTLSFLRETRFCGRKCTLKEDRRR
jgi:hypothetical protein